MDQTTLLAILFPIIINLVVAVVGAIVLWLIIRSAVLNALRRHERDSAGRYRAEPSRITPPQYTP